MIEAIIHSLEQAPSSFAALRAMRCSVGEKSSAISNGKLRRKFDRLAPHCGISAGVAVARHGNEETRGPMPAGCATQLT
jgi:hypothetical protein